MAAFEPDSRGCATLYFFLVTQRSAGGLVDKMHPGRRRAGCDLVAIRLNSRRFVRQPNLNVQRGPGAPKIELGHFFILIWQSRSALTCLKVVSSLMAIGIGISIKAPVRERLSHQELVALEMERRSSLAVESATGNAAMQRIKHPPIRNKIDMADPAQVRAWNRRLGISADALKAIVDKVGNSVAAVTKEVELQRAVPRTSPVPPIQSPPAEGEATPA
jgi:hypothetical protein